MDYQFEDTKSSQAAWLVKDDRLLASSLEMNVFELAALFQRDPLSVLRHLQADRPYDLLAKSGHEFEFEANSEEEAELIGLALSGVPLGSALLWCKGDEKRPAASTLSSMMPNGDCRPALRLARELGLWFGNAADIDDLVYLQEVMPEEILRAAVEDLLEQFQPPTPAVVRQFVEGELPTDTRKYTWFVEGKTSSGASMPGRHGGKSSARGSYGRKRRAPRLWKSRASKSGRGRKLYS